MPSESEKLNILVRNFNQLFVETENTRIEVGASEPFYRAPTANQGAVVYSRNHYFSSALHEIAHWCIAGKQRRSLDDFGYWYKPEGRSMVEQLEFERVEIKPQAIEWALSLASNHTFHFSADNLDQSIEASEWFKSAVRAQMVEYLERESLPDRAACLYRRLLEVFRCNQPVEFPDV